MPEVRRFLCAKLETVLLNNKLLKAAQEALAYCCANVISSNEQENITNIINVRWRQKPPTYYLQSLLLLMEANAINFQLMIQRIVYAEFEMNRNNQSNLAVIQFFIQHSTKTREATAKELARVFHFILVQYKSEMVDGQNQFLVIMRTLRSLLREIAKMAKGFLSEFLMSFSKTLMDEARLPLSDSGDNRKRMLEGLVDLLTLTMMLRTNPIREMIVKNAAPTTSKLSVEELEENMKQFRVDMPVMQQDVIRWIQGAVISQFKPDIKEVEDLLRRILFLNLSMKSLSDFDQWPQEPDRSALVSAITSCNVREGTLMRLAFIGTEYSTILGLDFIWHLVQRCCDSDSQVIISDSQMEPLAGKLLQLVWMKNPPIKLSDAKTIGLRQSLWRCWTLLLVLSAFSPATIGKYGWDNFPQMRILISFCITGRSTMTPDELQTVHHQRIKEKDAILLAEAETRGLSTISMDDARYVHEYCIVDPLNDMREIPPDVIEVINVFNKSIRLDGKLSENRDPDFLLLLMSSCDTDVSWIIKLVEQNDSFERLPVQVLAEYAINITNRPGDLTHGARYKLKGPKSASIEREQKIVTFLCSIATEPGPNQIKFLEHMVKRLSTDSSRVRNHAATLLYRTLHGDKMETDSTEPESLELGDILVKLDILRDSKEAIASLIKALYIESSINLIYAYLLLLEGFVDFKNTSVLLELTSAVSYFLCCKMMIVTPDLKSHETNENANNTLQFIRRLFLSVSELIFSSTSDEDETDRLLAGWRTEYDADVFNFTHQGRNRSIPSNFLCSLLIVLGLQYDPLLAEIWLMNGEQFITQIQFEPPKHVSQFLACCNVVEMVKFGMLRLAPNELLKSSGWVSMKTEAKEHYLAQLDERIGAENFQSGASLLPNLSFALRSLTIHQADGGKHGGAFRTFLEKHINEIVYRESSPVIMDVEMAKPNPKSDLKPESDSKISIEQQLNEIFVSPTGLNNRAVRLFLARLEVEPDLGRVIAVLTKIATSPDSTVFSYHATTFANIFKRLVSRLSRQGELINLEELCPTLSNLITDEKIAKSPGLKTMRILVSDLRKKLSSKTKASTDTEQNSPSGIISAMADGQPEKIEQKIKSTFSTVPLRDQILSICKALSTQKNDRVCGFLTDLFVEQNVDLLKVAPEEELELFFKSASRLPQLHSLFLQQARWETIMHCIGWLLSPKSAGMDSNAVLDFLWAVERLRLLWRGRELVSERCLQYILIFTVDQMSYYIDHFVGEATEKSSNLLDFRLTQLFHFMRAADFTPAEFQAVTEAVQKRHDEAMNNVIWENLLTMLYLFTPSNHDQVEDISTTSSTICSTDKIVYRVILDLAEIGDNSVIGDRMRDAHLFAIAIATSHPQLLLRHLPLLSRLLKGRTHHDFKDLKLQRHLDFFANFGGVLILLDKQLFRAVYRKHFLEIMDDYFQV